MADRYAYIPLIGIFVMIAWGWPIWRRRKSPSRLAGNSGIVRVGGAGLRHSPPDELLGERLHCGRTRWRYRAESVCA